MLHTKTPDTDGWYWISTEERQIDESESEVGHWMAYLDVETGDIGQRAKLFIAEPETDHCGTFFEMEPGVFQDKHFTYQLIEPKYWIGPLSCPFGPFGDSIIEPELELHLIAEKDKSVICIRHSNYQHADGPGGGTWTVIQHKPVSACEEFDRDE